MKTLFVTGMAAICGMVFAATAQTSGERTPFTVDDGLQMVGIGDVLISPDGQSVFYSTETLNWAENAFEKRYFLTSSSSPTSVEFVGSEGGDAFDISPDGKFLSFLRGGDEEAQPGSAEANAQLYLMPMSGGEAIQLTKHAGEIQNYKWASDSSFIILLAAETYSEEEEAEIKNGADAVFVDEAPNGKNRERFSNFWKVDLASGDTTRLSQENHLVEDFDLSPDGQTIAYTSRPDGRTNYIYEAELFLLRLEDQAIRRLTQNNSPEMSPLWSPDGSLLAYRSPDANEFELRNGYFWIYDVASGQMRQLDGQFVGELTGAQVWSRNNTHLYYNEIHGTDTNVYKIDVSSGESEPLTQVTGTLRLRALDDDQDTAVFSYSDFTTPTDLHVGTLSGDDRVQITDANPWVKAQRLLSDGEVVRWESTDGFEIEGVYFPPAVTPSGKFPLVLNIHGGPAGVIENGFRSDFQALTNQGYAILAPNFRGSTGGGDKLLRGLMGQVGDGEHDDLLTGIDHILETKDVDPDRLGVRGWSWGGVSTAYLITQTDRFKAASIGATVVNWAAETGPGFNFDLSLWYFGGTPWDNAQVWRQGSAITHVRNVTTPSILFHGADDQTSSPGQSLMFFTALRDIGKAPVRYIKFPRQGHGIDEPRLRRIYEMQEIKWLKQYIDGSEWDIPPFAAHEPD